MLTDKHLDRYADVLLWGLKKARTGKYKKNDIIMIRYDLAAIKLAEVLHEKLLHMKMNPLLRMGTTSRMELNFFKIANHEQLVFQPPGSRELCKKLNGSIFLHAPESLTHLSTVDPGKIGKSAIARKPLRDILNKREEIGAFGWTLCMLPTPELAKKASLPLSDYTNQLIKSCYLHKSHPAD